MVKSPVRENRPPGSVRGAPGNRRPYRDPVASKLSSRFRPCAGNCGQMVSDFIRHVPPPAVGPMNFAWRIRLLGSFHWLINL